MEKSIFTYKGKLGDVNDAIFKTMFDAYEKVRVSGKYNMFDERAIKESGLTKKDYLYVMGHYSELASKYKNA